MELSKKLCGIKVRQVIFLSPMEDLHLPLQGSEFSTKENFQKFRKGVGVEGVGVANCRRIIFKSIWCRELS